MDLFCATPPPPKYSNTLCTPTPKICRKFTYDSMCWCKCHENIHVMPNHVSVQIRTLPSQIRGGIFSDEFYKFIVEQNAGMAMLANPQGCLMCGFDPSLPPAIQDSRESAAQLNGSHKSVSCLSFRGPATHFCQSESFPGKSLVGYGVLGSNESGGFNLPPPFLSHSWPNWWPPDFLNPNMAKLPSDPV